VTAADTVPAGAAVRDGPARAPVAGAHIIWPIGATLTVALIAMPVLAITWIALFPTENAWAHLAATVLPGYIGTTLLLMLGVGIGVALMGTGAAWLVAMCRFPGRKVFAWLLIMPMAMPAYVIAYTYTDILEYAGPVQTALRAVFGWHDARDYWFPPVRSIGGAIAMLTLVLYPYVYLLARAAFLEQSVCALEVSRTLGRGPRESFLRVALPLARPAIVVGVMLALMETLNDFGTVDFFAVRTLTAGVFDVWFDMGNPGGAAQIALVLLGFVVLLIWLERHSRRRQRFHGTTTRRKPPQGFQLRGWKAGMAMLGCAFPAVAGFFVPAGVLLNYAVRHLGEDEFAATLSHAGNSVMLASIAAALTLVIGVFLAYAQRLWPSVLVRGAVRWASIGYALPGIAIAIGVLLPVGAFDNAVDSYMRDAFGISTGLLISGGIGALLIAYVVRFLAVSLGASESGLGKVTPNVDMAARTLGHGPFATLVRVHLPLIRGSVLTGAVLVFVDTMKELPATLVLRPFNFDTLATFVYQYASSEQLEDCSLAALTIVAAGILPVILLNHMIARETRDRHR
jgi:iron(III) transport system permease protein